MENALKGIETSKRAGTRTNRTKSDIYLSMRDKSKGRREQHRWCLGGTGRDRSASQYRASDAGTAATS
jgi:hypothetical protein